ncbi:MAG: hypothetical protein II663_00960 [Bacteroidales bacterium]|nr:hypothetical protein [Bacteroidales bacterium]
MKASEILKKRLEINSSWYGYASYKVVDFEYVNCVFKLYYDSFYNNESHIYSVSFSPENATKLLTGGEVIDVAEGEVTTTTTYRLID